MIGFLRQKLLSSRVWFALALGLTGAALLVGYHRDQMAAEAILSKMTGNGAARSDGARTLFGSSYAEIDLRHCFIFAAALSLMVGVILRFGLAGAQQGKPRRVTRAEKPVSGSTDLFQPIRPQDELVRETARVPSLRQWQGVLRSRF